MMRVLEVVTNLQVGGIERWLLEVTPRLDQRRVRVEFACRTVLEANRVQLERAGATVHVVPDLLHPWRGLQALRGLAAREGPFDAIHTHLHHMSGLVLWMARWAGFRVRIAHSHLDSRPIERNAGRRFLARNAALAALIQRYATAGLACSADAGASLYGGTWTRDSRWRVLHYGIDLTPFTAPPDRGVVRRECGIPDDAFVVGNIARFAEQKNHSFLVDVAAAMVRRDPACHFLFVGDGPLRSVIEAKIAALDLQARIHIVTDRTDVSALTPAMDVFVFPSLYEGLGIALIEAQAAGLRCVLTDTLPAEAGVVHQLLHRMPLAAGAEAWAEAVLSVRRRAEPIGRQAALATVERSAYNVATSASRLEDFYAEQLSA